MSGSRPVVEMLVEALESSGRYVTTRRGRRCVECPVCRYLASECDRLEVWGDGTCPGKTARRALAAFWERAPTEDSIARYFILNGKYWRDPDGPTVVDGVDADEGAGYPVKYHWESGGHGANSVRGFLRENHLPMEEVVQLVAALLGSPAPQGGRHG